MRSRGAFLFRMRALSSEHLNSVSENGRGYAHIRATSPLQTGTHQARKCYCKAEGARRTHQVAVLDLKLFVVLVLVAVRLVLAACGRACRRAALDAPLARTGPPRRARARGLQRVAQHRRQHHVLAVPVTARHLLGWPRTTSTPLRVSSAARSRAATTALCGTAGSTTVLRFRMQLRQWRSYIDAG